MGALLSIPLLALPSVGTLASVGASCCGAAACSAICSACGKCQSSIATRIAYALILLVNSIVSWIMLSPWAIKKLQHLTLDYARVKCGGEDCTAYTAVHRVNFALGMWHALLAILLLGVRSTKNGRAAIQNGFWGPKLAGWIAFIVVSFFIPNTFFVFWGNYIAYIGAIMFLLLGLILLVDLAHTWAEYCLSKIEDNEAPTWRVLLLGSTFGMYAASIAMTIGMYIFFAGSGCAMNQAAITVNLLMLLGASILSVYPTIQEFNPRAGLAQSAMVAVYCTYLTMSAVSMEPDDRQCNPLIRANGTRTASVVIGALVTMLTIAYTTTRAATQGFVLSSKNGAIQLDDEPEHGLASREYDSSREMRAEALRAAVAEGSLPASALEDDDDESDSGKKRDIDDEKTGTRYDYSTFHLIFLLATMWVATLLTQNVNLESGHGDFAQVGRSYWASWTKIVSAWVCYGIYSWTLVAPVVLPERFGY